LFAGNSRLPDAAIHIPVIFGVIVEPAVDFIIRLGEIGFINGSGCHTGLCRRKLIHIQPVRVGSKINGTGDGAKVIGFRIGPGQRCQTCFYGLADLRHRPIGPHWRIGHNQSRPCRLRPDNSAAEHRTALIVRANLDQPTGIVQYKLQDAVGIGLEGIRHIHKELLAFDPIGESHPPHQRGRIGQQTRIAGGIIGGGIVPGNLPLRPVDVLTVIIIDRRDVKGVAAGSAFIQRQSQKHFAHILAILQGVKLVKLNPGFCRVVIRANAEFAGVMFVCIRRGFICTAAHIGRNQYIISKYHAAKHAQDNRKYPCFFHF